MKGRSENTRGDTLIEVLLSMAVLSLLIVGGNAIINFGMKNAITAVEHTQVRNLVLGQAELLRYVRDNGASGAQQEETWKQILARSKTAVSEVNPAPQAACPEPPRAFYLSTGAFPNNPAVPPAIGVANYPGNPPGPRLAYARPGEGLWVEAKSVNVGEQNYTDFHIRACWSGAGTDIKQRVSTVVRLRSQ